MEFQKDQAAEMIELMQSPCFTKSDNHSLFGDVDDIGESQPIPFDLVSSFKNLDEETIEYEKDFLEPFIKSNEDLTSFEKSKVSIGEEGQNNSAKSIVPQKRRWTKVIQPSEDELKDRLKKFWNELQLKSQNVSIDKNGRERKDSTTLNQILINKNWR